MEYAGWGTLLIALAVWALGVVIARVGVALVFGLVGAAVAALLAQHCGHQAFLAAVGVGFAAGAGIGALGFKAVQAFTLALLMGAAVAGLYYHWHVEAISAPALPSPTAIAALPTTLSSVLPTQPSIQALQISIDKWTPQQPMTFTALAGRIKEQFVGTSARHLRHMLIAALGSAVVALLVAYNFPRLTTGIVTSVAGAALILAAARVLVQIHSPHQAGLFPSHAWSRYCALVIVAGVGFLIQYRIFLRPPDKSQKIKAPQQAHA